jgi:hypothetical protein
MLMPDYIGSKYLHSHSQSCSHGEAVKRNASSVDPTGPIGMVYSGSQRESHLDREEGKL